MGSFVDAPLAFKIQPNTVVLATTQETTTLNCCKEKSRALFCWFDVLQTKRRDAIAMCRVCFISVQIWLHPSQLVRNEER